MRIAIHLGAHCTDEDRLLRTLLANKGALAAERIAVPGPGRYRRTLVAAIQKLRGEAASAEAEETLVDAIIDDDSAERIVLTFEDFICVPGRIFDNQVLYDKAGYKPLWLRNAFPSANVEFFLAIRNPATFIPAAYRHKRQKTSEFRAFLGGVDPDLIRWSDVLVAIREACPEAPLTVWCNEDTPLIWSQVIREVAGCPEEVRLSGGLDILAAIMKREGMRRMRAYLRDNPPRSEVQRRHILGAFLEKYAIDEAVEEEIDLPGWTEDLIARLTENYEEDIDEIRSLPGVNFIAP